MANTSTRDWSPNGNQQLILKVLEGKSDGLTLAQIKSTINKDRKEAISIASGTITPLVKKGLLTSEKVKFECDVFIKGTQELLTTENKTLCVYKLAKADGQKEVAETTTPVEATTPVEESENDLDDDDELGD